MTHVATFQVAGHASTAIEALTELGFAFGSPQAITTTVLDTFDGRLHRSGLRLIVTESDHLHLELSGQGTTPAHMAIPTMPRVPADLPPGPFRTRIAAVIGIRAMLPQLRLSTDRTLGLLRDGSDKAVAIAELHEAIHVHDQPHTQDVPATIGIREVAGYTKSARLAAATLRRLELTECETDTVTTLCAAASGVDFAGFKATATVPLDPEMPAIDGFRLVLDHLATAVTANWQGTIDQADPEFLHDLRIAVRRTRTVLAEAKTVLPAAILEPARDEFGWLADLTGPPRDLDVYLLEWSRYTDPLHASVAPLLDSVRVVLEGHRTDAHIALESAMGSERARELMSMWQTWLAEPPANDSLPQRARRPLGPLVARRITRAQDILLKRGRRIGPDTPAEQVHDLRKDAKKLRYLLECFGSLQPKGPRKQYVRRLKALQDNLGEHQDASVHADMLRAVAREIHGTGVSADTMVAIGQLTERLDQQCLAARADFAACFAEYDTPATRRSLAAVLKGIAE